MDLKFLIDQLEAELIAQTRQLQLNEAAEMAEGETAQITLIERLNTALGNEISFYQPNGQMQAAQLTQVGKDWILVRKGIEEELINLKNCHQIGGLKDAHLTMREIQKRSQINQILRLLGRKRARVLVTLVNGNFQTGYLVSVFADHFEIINQENRQRLSIASAGVFSIKVISE
ncbi:hypothetical protein NXS08_00960 [Gleimia sp. 6138-11-ORH1]|uniref:hypothetical protein n=1 Tax=Gleimia sp. 6138-11-ORH1 TaxID=2973937 RepID=UPI0021691DF1|nr:hypothetical protein [Gleimia sp. 6138-11-ORH1]MCS4484062.1 hypothetical protein [Gleimia sp. 6138-11-ORH1]